MPTGNPFFDVTAAAGEEIFKAKQESVEQAKTVVPFGYEPKPRPEQYRKRFEEGGEEFRKAELKRFGRKGVYTLMGLKGKH